MYLLFSSYGYPTHSGFAIRIGKPKQQPTVVNAASSSNSTNSTAGSSASSSLSSSGFSLVCTIHNGISEYEVSAPLPAPDQWVNVGMSWSLKEARGISLYINGNLTG